MMVGLWEKVLIGKKFVVIAKFTGSYRIRGNLTPCFLYV